ncbi:hypothetical protein CPC08DRAFT_713395 [Agrocybe pediades]|nr:hypothetical protein CPC08DRAFT_713395 [Agrocybe pediades]
MVLLTPPNSSHRTDKEKENKFPSSMAGPSTRSVSWATHNSIHSLSTPVKSAKISSKHRNLTGKSILKKSSQVNLPASQDVANEREVTPEPTDPLVDLHYLDHPVEQILAVEAGQGEESLHEIITGYNVLAERLRSTVTGSTDVDASWPLFQPLRKNSQPFVNAVVRDLGRALVNPLSSRSNAKYADDTHKFPLPSPQKSPMKKKGGLNEEQVKYGRDLTNTCLSVIRALTVILSLPAIFSVFHENQLKQILTAILAIPLADELPTPNSRKTCALAIWLLQLQRLPRNVLRPAAPRIAYALQKGLDGELGKEGKKGAANDGLKAIHDLSMHIPDVFVPAFTPILPSVLSNLLAPTLALRTQACHALGGFAFASTLIPQSVIHTQIARHVASFLTRIPPPTTKSPTKPADPLIVRTLRTTLICTDPSQVAQGPVWAICVIASFIVLLRARLCADSKVNRSISSLLSLGLEQQRSSIRALCCAAWRPLTWAYFQPPLLVDPESEEGEDFGSDVSPEEVRNVFYKVLTSVVNLQAGIGIVAALMGDPNIYGKETVQKALDILYIMSTKDEQCCDDALEALRHMTGLYETEVPDDIEPWSLKLLLPKSLFCASPGLLTTEFKALSSAVRPIFDQLAMIHDIRPFTRKELAAPTVYVGVVRVWRTALRHLQMSDDAKVPESLVDIWTNLFKANMAQLQADGQESALSAIAFDFVRTLCIIAEENFDFRPKNCLANNTLSAMEAACAALGSDDTIPDANVSATCSAEELRVRVIHALWTPLKKALPSRLRVAKARQLMYNLAAMHASLVPKCGRLLDGFDEGEGEAARDAWVALILDILSVADLRTFKDFWGGGPSEDGSTTPWRWTKEFIRAIWRTSAFKWAESEDSWEAAVVLLGLPFSDRLSWGMSGGDFTVWEELLAYTTAKALDDGIDSCQLLDIVSTYINEHHTPSLHPATSTRLVDAVVSHIDAADMRDIPAQVLALIATTLSATYPPEPKDKQFALWMVRSLAGFIEHCPGELCLRVLQTLEDGICMWLSDDAAVFSEHEFNYDIIPFYQHILVRVRILPESLDTLRVLESVLDSIFTNRAPSAAVEAFTEYWKNTYARAPAPEKWPKAITHALQATGLLPSSESPSSALEPAFIPLPESPRTPVSSSFSTPPTAIRKREALSRPPSPQRPHKVYPSFPIVPTTPVSPLRQRSSSSVARTPLSAIQTRDSPNKRRRLMADVANDEEDEKENMLVEEVVPVMDRISGLKPAGKKRRLEEDVQLAATPVKKLKGRMKPKNSGSATSSQKSQKSHFISNVSNVASSNNEKEEEEWVESSLLGDGLARQVQLAKRECDAEESGEKPNMTPKRKIDLAKVQMRRASSIPETFLAATTSRKRKRSASVTPDEDNEDLYDACNSDTPLPRLPIPAAHASLSRKAVLKKSYTVPMSDSEVGATASSDDDPHVGQVTPHHLISPALMKKALNSESRYSKTALTIMKELFGDDIDALPGSDDSNASGPGSGSGSESDSPIKGFVARQVQRMGSQNRVSMGC